VRVACALHMLMHRQQGFRYFRCHLRGREELLVSIINDGHPSDADGPLSDSASIAGSTASSGAPVTAAPATAVAPADDVFHRVLGSSRMDSVSSESWQSLLNLRPGSDHNDSDSIEVLSDALPHSPCSESDHAEESETVFLIAGYSKYLCPYVWVRSNHARFLGMHPSLIHSSGGAAGSTYAAHSSSMSLNSSTSSTSWQSVLVSEADHDRPLQLKSIRDVRALHVIAELVTLCVLPTPRNPFAIDRERFTASTGDTMRTRYSRVLAAAAMMRFLIDVVRTPGLAYMELGTLMRGVAKSGSGDMRSPG
jgi:hypothetical protein